MDYLEERKRKDEQYMIEERARKAQASREMGRAMGYEYPSQEFGGDGWSAWG